MRKGGEPSPDGTNTSQEGPGSSALLEIDAPALFSSLKHISILLSWLSESFSKAPVEFSGL